MDETFPDISGIPEYCSPPIVKQFKKPRINTQSFYKIELRQQTRKHMSLNNKRVKCMVV